MASAPSPSLRTACAVWFPVTATDSEASPPLATAIAASIRGPAVLDGEVVCLGPDGVPQFYDLMRRRQPQYFCAFDLLWEAGDDLRATPLLQRKRRPRTLLRTGS